jgi:hypothetical protein
MPNASQMRVAWSADNTTLAWQDGAGLWHWNLFDQAAAQQVLDAEAVEALPGNGTLQDVSRDGRFLRLGTPPRWALVDVTTGEVHRNAIATPNEQTLVYFDDGSDEARVAQDEQRCTAPLRATCAVYVPTDRTLQHIFYYEMNLLGMVSCHQESGEQVCFVDIASWYPSIVTPNWIGRDWLDLFMRDVRQIRYDVDYHQPAVVVGDSQVYLQFYAIYETDEPEYAPYLDIIDFADESDSPIASIEWGQPVFFSRDHIHMTG